MSKNDRSKQLARFSRQVIKEINARSPMELMPLAKRVCGTNYAVRFYLNESCHKFFLNTKAFKHALRRCWNIGSLSRKEQMVQYFGLDQASEKE